jgi:hypothetical protein
MREGSSLSLFNNLMSSWEMEEPTEFCSEEIRRGRACWKVGTWRMMVVMRKNEQEICPIYSKEEN